MQPKRSKYDTNPLDGNVAERADQDWGRDTGLRDDPPTQAMSGGVRAEICRTSTGSARNPEDELPASNCIVSFVIRYANLRPYISSTAACRREHLSTATRSTPHLSASRRRLTPTGSQKLPLGLPEKWA